MNAPTAVMAHPVSAARLRHLVLVEQGSIHIIREVAAGSRVAPVSGLVAGVREARNRTSLAAITINRFETG